MKGTHKILSLLVALVLVISMFATIIAPASAVVTAVSFTPSPTTAGATATWTIAFTPGTPLSSGDTISIVFPAGVTVPTTIAKEYIMVGGTPATVDAAVSGNKVIVTAPGVATNVVFSQVAGIKNPTNATVGYVGTVETSVDPGPVSSAPFSPSRAVILGTTRAAVGTSVTVTGVGFLPNSSIDLTGDVVGAGSTDGSGSFSISGLASGAGGAGVTATDGGGYFAISTATLTMIPLASLSPASGLSGSVVEVTVTGLLGTTSYALGVSGVQVPVISCTVGALTGVVPEEITTDGTGKFVARFAIPSGLSAGAKVINVRAAGFLGLDLATGTFTIDARTLTPSISSGFKGDTVVFSGAGFEPSGAGQVVTAQLVFVDSTGLAAGTKSNLLTTPASVGADGSFSCSVTVPATGDTGLALAAGRGTFTATSSINGTPTASTASAFFTINPPTITCTPTTGLAGTEVVVTMKGLGAYATYNSVTIDAATVINFSQSVVTDANGNLSAKFIWPGLAPGAHTFIVTGTTPVATFTQQAGAVTVTGGLNSIAGKYTKVWTWDGATQTWQLYDTAAPAVSDLSSLQAGQGYWIQATEAGTIVYGGNTYPIYVGWTLIGWRG